ncbi:olfactory receptor 5W2 [Cricetulus griseus]|uniref:Olfactory receptor 5W2 n=1 Tax=Cricetulus griseus TaxID=10029 RepID=A0A9J7G5U6_CRIGR|nr:olfactory receptor 5W2 [Cricetulus griseus]ERE69586.1 olfactory receptor 5W2-like protein [Cricetulus griseus]
MEKKNCSSLPEFFLLGISSNPDMKGALFVVFLVVYLIILLANVGMIILIKMDPHLHTPMYFFLSHLAFSDLSYSTAVGPKMLLDLLTDNNPISFVGCFLRFLLVCTFIDIECMLLAVMAFYRYKAISNPLMYAIDMSTRVCYQFVTGIYLLGTIDGLIHTSLAFSLCFCGSTHINQFFCDFPAILLLSCSDTQLNELVLFTLFGFIELSTISGVLISYCYIISSVLKTSSSGGRFKAFSTCASHLTAVGIFQGTMLFMYFRPSSAYSLDQDKMTSVFYLLIIPMINPLIYSLRNKDVKEAMVRLRNKSWI